MFLSVQPFLQCHTAKQDFYQTILAIKAWDCGKSNGKTKSWRRWQLLMKPNVQYAAW